MQSIKVFPLVFTLLVFLSSYLTATVYEDAEDGNTAGWRIYDADPAGAQILNVYDNDRGSNVIQLQGDFTSNGYILGGWEGSADAWGDSSSTTLTWSMKYNEYYTVYIRVMTTNGARYIYYTPSDTSNGGTDEYVHLGLGTSTRNGTWLTFTRDLQADLAQFQPGNTITQINAFLVRGSGFIDDIEVGGAPIAPCTTQTPDNLVSNPCVEQSPTGWSAYGSTEGGWVANEGYSGTHSLKITNLSSQNSGWRYTDIPINNARTITFGGWSKAENVNAGALYALDFYVKFADGTDQWFAPQEIRFSTGTHDWEHKELTYTFDKDVVLVRPYLLLYYDTGTVWYDDIYVIPSIPPIANAGADQTALLGVAVILDASGSSDADGNIVSYDWSEGGTALATGINPSVSLGASTHTLTLTVTDNDGNVDTDTVTITVTAPPLLAVNDSYNTGINTNISANALANDTGANISYVPNSATTPSNGTLVFNSDGSFVYTPNPSFTGTDSFRYTITDITGAIATAQVTLTISATVTQGTRNFAPRFQQSLYGNIVTIGNTLLVPPSTANANTCNTYTNAAYLSTTANTNTSYILCSYFADTAQTFPTTKAKLTLPTAQSNIVWAGLYWQALVSNTDPRSPSNSNTMQIRIKHENDANYQTVSYDQLDWAQSPVAGYDNYAAFANVTALFQNNNWRSGDIFVGDVPIHETTQAWEVGGLGTFGAWSLVVVYNDPNESLKNFSVYDGWVAITGATPNATINISGFKTPKSVSASKPIKATLSVFTAEGDRNILGDGLVVQPGLQANPTSLSYTTNQTFDSSIITPISFTREPNPSNNQGIDIQAFDLGTTGVNIIKPNETNISITVNSVLQPNGNQDNYWASMISFSADLLVPEVCYDYTIQQNGFDITDDGNRTIQTFGKGDLSINIALQSLEGDFDLESSKLSISLDPTMHTNFDHAKYSPNNTNALIDALLSNQHTALNPSIAIGENVDRNGGTIKRLQRYFSEFTYTLDANNYTGTFDIELNSTVDFGSGPVTLLQSTRDGTIKRCPQSPIYNPIKGSFNVERPNSTGNPDEKFPLFTQVVGKDFDFEVVAYNQSATPPFSTELNLDGYTVDVELINVNTYSDQNLTFTCNNPNPSIIQNLDANGTKHVFARFDNNSSRVDLSSLNIQTDRALRSAAFRIFYIVDQNNTILKHQCTDENDEGCFETLYQTHLQANDTTLLADGVTRGFCQRDCTDGTNNNCYQCLRNFFSHAVCSRDNFAIRPAAYRLTIADSNQSLTNPSENDLGINDDAITPVATLAAGYDYKLKGIPTSNIGPDTKALGYTRTFDATSLSADKSSQLIFDPTTGANCADTNSTTWEVRFLDGNITGVIGSGVDANLSNGVLVKHSNVGIYHYALHDANWTQVDHRDYQYKTYDSQDCIANSNTITADPTAQSGCNIDTNLTGDGRYEDLLLSYMPYKFDINNVGLDTIPTAGSNYIFMNDFENKAYDDPIVRPLTMSALFSGTVVAKGADDTTTTNFDTECVAQDLSLHLDKHMNPAENTIFDENDTLVLFQQYLQTSSSETSIIVAANRVTEPNATTPDANTTIFSSAFNDGNASIRLHTNLKKPMQHFVQTGVNPVDINFTKLSTASAGAQSSAHLQNNYTPKGSKDYNSTIRAYFSKISPAETLYPNIVANFQMTSLFVDIFCNLPLAQCNAFGLNTLSQVEGADWYRASDLPYVPATDGTTDIVTNGIGNAVADLSRANQNGQPRMDDQLFDGPAPGQVGEITDLRIALPANAPRPAVVDVSIEPDPWHVYDINSINGFPKIRTEWIGGGSWSGVGNTGDVTQMESSGDRNGQRLNW